VSGAFATPVVAAVSAIRGDNVDEAVSDFWDRIV